MAQQTPCQTPDAVYATEIGHGYVSVRVELPHALDLTEAEAELLEANMHNAMEMVLARYFR